MDQYGIPIDDFEELKDIIRDLFAANEFLMGAEEEFLVRSVYDFIKTFNVDGELIFTEQAVCLWLDGRANVLLDETLTKMAADGTLDVFLDEDGEFTYKLSEDIDPESLRKYM